MNQYTSIGGQAVSHNAAGNLTNDGAGSTYTYDMENHLVSVTGPKSGTLRYDALGRLSRMVTGGNTTQFLYDGDALVAEYLNGTLSYRYVHGDQVDEPLIQYAGTNLATRRYLHADHQGSIIAHSDTSGAVTQKNAYDPYGIPASTNEGRFGYTGQAWLKELGLNYYKARIYSPRLGRFLQTDPIFYEDEMNLYGYVGNDPLNMVDPTGLTDRAPGPSAEMSLQMQIDSLRFMEETSARNSLQGNPLARDFNSYLGKALDGDGWGAIDAGLSLLKNSWKDAYSTKAGAVLTTMSMIPIVGIEANAAKGIIASNGTSITGLTRHGVHRAIGNAAERAGTRPQAILDALRNPKKISGGVDSQGRPFQVFTGADARVVINPQTGQIVSVNPMSRAGAL